LQKRLGDVLTRSASWPTWFPGGLLGYWLPIGGLLFIGLFVGIGVSILIGYGDHTTGPHVGSLGGVVVVGPLLGTLIAWTLPSLEILDENTRVRFDRFRLWVVGAIATVLLGVMSAVIYGLAT
jgi:hypothetical protein